MWIPVIIIILGTFTHTLAKDNGKSYEKEKICEGLQAVGSAKFREVVIAVYSQKFPNGTFEEVTCVAEEMAKLAEKCCLDDANPDCYDKGATAISDKSCRKDSPFPKHPGITQCCVQQGRERKLCLAMLRYAADELPSLLEPSNEEICKQYQQDPVDYSARYVYELARRHRSIPAGFILNATQNQVKMAETCCSLAHLNPCFFKERYELRKSSNSLRFLSNVCNNRVNLRSHKTGLAVYYGGLLKSSFEEAMTTASSFHTALTKCCLQPHADCLLQEFSGFQKILCNESTMTSMSVEFESCCKKTPLESLMCVDNMKRQPPQTADTPPTLSSQLCQETQPHAIERYLFQIGVKHASVSRPMMTTILDSIKHTVIGCCNSTDTQACMRQQEAKVEKTAALLSQTDNMCSQYFRLDFPEFKKKMHGEIQGEGKEERVEAVVKLASTCCFQHSPAVLCQKLMKAFIESKDDTIV
ncbi:vitamin D-binding protein [Chanos chanos]|uniref:Vitamin D-binding protein n=1 Tax=Chanos chanos TaxID=29144 RepID=A0A6J2V8F4_CHACN|nr:vitamin D-binding protein [Chanos chanos]